MMFWDNKELQKKLWTIVDQSKDQDLMPGLNQRRSIGQEVDADAYIDSQEKTQAAMDKMKKGMAEGVETDAKVYQNKMTGKFVAWVEIGKNIIKQDGNTKEEAVQNLIDHVNKTRAPRKQASGQNLHKQEVTSVGFNSAFVSGVIRMSGQTFFAQFNDGKLLISATPLPGFRKVSKVVPSPTGTFSKNDIQNAGLNLSQRYDITPIGQSDSGISIFKLSHHSDVSHANDRLRRQTPSLTIQLAGRNMPQQGMAEDDVDEGFRVANQQIPGTKTRAQSAYYPTSVKSTVKKLDKPLTDQELARLSQLAGIKSK
jgi:hypothetical protein